MSDCWMESVDKYKWSEIDYDKASTSKPFSRYITNISKFSCDILLILKIALFYIGNTLNPSALNPSHIIWSWALSLILCEPFLVDLPNIKPHIYNTTPQIYNHHIPNTGTKLF